ncbi:MAG: 4Fe-4S dicluster domain-containing protein [Deinococcales bacterium]
MNVRAQMSMIFHLDKCIGCHTCSVACKNLWTDRKGTEYMWWNNVETRPGTGYPTGWEDQEAYRGGWRLAGDRLELRLHSRASGLARLFYNPALPSLEDYYEPFTFRYQDLFDAPAGDDQPTAEPVSMLTGERIDIESGPNWDDDLSGSDVYAASDLNLDALEPEVREQFAEIDRVVMNYLPRICNHCLNPSCVAACPTGAIYKRGEDGVVLVNEDKCRAWRMCVAACPYKKVYYNWHTGKSPFDPAVVAAAREAGLDDGWIDAAQRSPAYRFVKEWGIALPLHPEFRTMAMMFYVPPLSPVVSTLERELVKLRIPAEDQGAEVFRRIDDSRLPVRYLASLFAGGNEELIRVALRKLLAVRALKRRQSVEGEVDARTLAMLDQAGMSLEEAEAMYCLTTLPTLDERFVLPPYHREAAIEAANDPLAHKGATGFGSLRAPERGE